jgi:hypothetical protein
VSDGQDDPFTWSFWHLDWNDATAGEHAITSRAIDAGGKQAGMNVLLLGSGGPLSGH